MSGQVSVGNVVGIVQSLAVIAVAGCTFRRLGRLLREAVEQVPVESHEDWRARVHPRAHAIEMRIRAERALLSEPGTGADDAPAAAPAWGATHASAEKP